MINNIDVKFFCHGYDELTGEIELIQISENDFLDWQEQGGSFSYARHTIAEDGVRQICLKIDN